MSFELTDNSLEGVDLPTYLSTIPARRVRSAYKCPHCGGGLVGLYEASTNSLEALQCPGCGFDEAQGCNEDCTQPDIHWDAFQQNF